MLYIIATPIGNLKDITLRALDTLKKVDYILSEDTRNSCHLLSHFNIKTPLISFHQHSDNRKRNQVVEKLKKGKDLALISDAGTPTISDPGGRLVNQVKKDLPKLKIVPIPGACALITGLSISGFKADKFLFLGFPPKKRKRNKFFKKIANANLTTVFYESPHRIIKTLEELKKFKAIQKRKICLCREMTKMYETIYRGDIRKVLQNLKSDTIKGEFTVIVSSD